MDAQSVLTTTRSVRKRLDLQRPVPRELLLECLEVAVQAPTGSNSQGWQFVIVTDPDKKRVIGDLYRESWTAYAANRGPRYERDDPRRAQLPAQSRRPRSVRPWPPHRRPASGAGRLLREPHVSG